VPGKKEKEAEIFEVSFQGDVKIYRNRTKERNLTCVTYLKYYSLFKIDRKSVV